jgi:PadR family transcriptional regulator AphA
MSTTSYAVLGLLCVQPWSAYELTQQMKRSLRFMWPRAESGIYREPQKLVELGYASVAEVAAGPRRTKSVYTATPAGRRALRRWLRAPSAPPQFESEALVKFFFADQGDLGTARLALDELSAHATRLEQAFRAITASYADGPGPFPERLHIGAVIGRFLFQYETMLGEWASWARGHVDEWPTTGPNAAPWGEDVQRENAQLAAIATGSGVRPIRPRRP